MSHPTTEKIWSAVNAYLENHNAPKMIVLPLEDFQNLKAEINSSLPLKMHYDPNFFYGIPLVISKVEKEIKCKP